MTKERRQTIFVCLLLGFGCIAIYWPARGFDFVYFDDPLYVVNNFHINQGWSWPSWQWCFQAGYAANWHPVTWMSHMTDCQWFGVKPGGAHLVNLLLHSANSMLLFLLLRRMTQAIWRSALVAALFALHPVHVESVAWISERKDVLSAFFWILTIWAYVHYVNKRNAMRYLLTLLLFMVALMAKPMVVTLPFVLLLLDGWPLRRVQRGRIGRLILEKTPFFLLSAGSCVLTVLAQHRGGAISSFARVPMAERLANSAMDYLRYAEKLFWPVNLSIIYPLVPSSLGAEMIVASVFIVGLTVGAILLVKKHPYCLVGWLWYLGALVPVIGLVQVGSQSMADRYTYLPSIGFFILICWGGYDIASRLHVSTTAMGIAAVVVLTACACATERQLGYWKDSGELFRHALDVDPDNYLAHNYYGAFLREQHQLPEAEAECAKAVEIAPAYAMGHVFLSGILLLEGKQAEAAAEIRAALSYEPDLVMARINLGDILFSQGRYADAAAEYGKAVEYNPGEPKLHVSLGRMLRLQNKLDEAQGEFEQALNLNPASIDAHFELAETFALKHKPAEAVAEYRAALRLQPNFSDALNNLAWILATDPDPHIRNGAEAVQLAEHACQLTRHQQAFKIGTLAAAYAEAGRFDDAVAAAQMARDVAQTHGEKGVAETNQKLENLYKSHQAYHLPVQGL